MSPKITRWWDTMLCMPLFPFSFYLFLYLFFCLFFCFCIIADDDDDADLLSCNSIHSDWWAYCTQLFTFAPLSLHKTLIFFRSEYVISSLALMQSHWNRWENFNFHLNTDSIFIDAFKLILHSSFYLSSSCIVHPIQWQKREKNTQVIFR